jgi:FkbM family methyltransferase
MRPTVDLKKFMTMTDRPEAKSVPESELNFWLAITRRLPHVRGAGKISKVAESIYNRKKRAHATVDVLGFKMTLDPTDSMERQFLFSPQLYDRTEMAVLREHLKPGHTFVDAGANVGFYSLMASKLVGNSGRIISVEADPFNASRLAANIQLSQAANVRIVNVGLSDKAETLRLGLSMSGNRGGNSFLYDSPKTVSVECKTLTDVLVSEGIKKVDGAKFDIEGFEFRVLQRFFQDGHTGVWPGFFIIEHNDFYAQTGGGDTLKLLSGNGYDVRKISELNYLAVRK